MKPILLFISSLVFAAASTTTAQVTTEQAVNLSSTTSSNTFCAANEQQIDNTVNEVVDINRFTQLLSNHLLFDHFDKAYLQLSRKISFSFRDAIQVRVKKVKTKSKDITTATNTAVVVTPPVDVQILKRQLKGAVGSFVEDKLPAILTNRYNTTSLQNQLDELLYQYCPPMITYNKKQCLLDNRELFLSEIHRYTTNELQSTLFKVNEFDLPRLFEKTRAQISGILIHFNQHTMDKDHHRLELKIKSNPNTAPQRHQQKAFTKQQQPQAQQSGKVHNWITPEMIQEFISIVNHTDHEEGNTSIQHFLELSM